MSENATWSDRFACGYAPMDYHHENFVGLLAAMESCTPAQVPGLLDALVKQCEEHFGEENELMRATDCPAADCHIGEHDAVLVSVREVRAITDAARQSEVARKLVQQLRRWFEPHVTHLDSAVAHWVVKQRVGGIPIVLRRNLRAELGAEAS
jgi:hemerythrin